MIKAKVQVQCLSDYHIHQNMMHMLHPSCPAFRRQWLLRSFINKTYSLVEPVNNTQYDHKKDKKIKQIVHFFTFIKSNYERDVFCTDHSLYIWMKSGDFVQWIWMFNGYMHIIQIITLNIAGRVTSKCFYIKTSEVEYQWYSSYLWKND
jgi:hypothetical protein